MLEFDGDRKDKDSGRRSSDCWQKSRTTLDDRDEYSSNLTLSDSSRDTTKVSMAADTTCKMADSVELKIPTVTSTAKTSVPAEALFQDIVHSDHKGEVPLSSFAVSQLVQLGAFYSLLNASTVGNSAPPMSWNSSIYCNKEASNFATVPTSSFPYAEAQKTPSGGSFAENGNTTSKREQVGSSEITSNGGEESDDAREGGMEVGQQKNVRKSYTREEKLQVLDWYQKNGRNKYRTAKMFGMNIRTLSKWVRAEDTIRRSRYGSMKAGSGRRPYWPDMEKQLFALHKEETERRNGDDEIPASWYRENAELIMQQLYPNNGFSFTLQWLERFKRRYNIPV